MTRFVADPLLAELTSFQRDTVEHVTRRFYGPEPAQHFLVADETGLGKSWIARGVIARTIERLQDDPAVDRIDIVYICSNADIAEQNLARLNVTTNDGLPIGDRLTMAILHSRRYGAQPNGLIDKPINLVSFTPGTSFSFGHKTGQVRERALLWLLLEDYLCLDGWQTRAARLVFTHPAGARTFDREHAGLLAAADDIEPVSWRKFLLSVRNARLDRALIALFDEIGRRRTLTDGHKTRAGRLIGELRRRLARVNIDELSPDLVILDEFQRFPHLIDGDAPESELARSLFGAECARVLLLSATPYKPFTYAEEVAENHRNSFLRTLGFLADGCPSLSTADIEADLDEYRSAATAGRPVAGVAARLRAALTRVMTRQERPRHVDELLLTERLTACAVSEDDLVEYVRLQALAHAVDGELPIDYWKSVPYFANFMETYHLGGRVRAALRDRGLKPRAVAALRELSRLDPADIEKSEDIDLGNARLRTLAEQTTGAGWWRLLWLPPSLPYLRPEGAYADLPAVTKRLVFSAWTAAPTAVAALLSYDAQRRLGPDARSSTVQPLAYRADTGPAALTTLAMFWPAPGLAALADPRWLARGGAIDIDTAETWVQAAIEPHRRRVGLDHDEPWLLTFAWPDSVPPDGTEIAACLRGTPTDSDAEDEDGGTGLDRLVEEALAVAAGQPSRHRRGARTGVTLARLALHSPGNIAWRALRRVAGGGVTAAGLWGAAALLASGLRALFNRPETVALLTRPGDDYRAAVLRYCAQGNLQAVLDEYLHHLADDRTPPATDDALWSLADRARAAIALRPAPYVATDPLTGERIALPGRFALRYGTRPSDEDHARQPEVRNAFNSPFWPFVLASTSVGQEGIDFHWWCHSVLHWNTPTNPVDFEQREGRIHRYRGHAVRRNIAATHGAQILASADDNPWRAAYQIAGQAHPDLGEFAPHWVYPGPAAIERHLVPYPLSQDVDRLERVKSARMLYRLTFGQPRQEDMLELLRAQGLDQRPDDADSMRIDLSPPRGTHDRAPLPPQRRADAPSPQALRGVSR